ncbi:MAG TPA: anti-sigma factor [Erythrobacter sp.]|nr:anti-sigma factor [Erythrobacter sp.]
MNSKLTPEQTAMAAELALGVLDGEERAEAIRQSLADPAFAAMVRKWQDRLDPLGEDYAETPPPANLWPAIEARLDAQPRSGNVRELRFWRGATALAGALAAGLAAVVVLRPPTIQEVQVQAPAGPAAIAQLAGEDGTLLAANLSPQDSRLSIRAVTLPDSALVPELWIIPGDGVPRSLGLISADGTTLVVLPPELKSLMVDGAILAVSLETPEGAPHTAPSSTPIATGKISTI